VAGAPLSSELRDELFAAAETLLACGAVVVRSSAVGEDSRGASFAGQLDSILHVTTLTGLERAILRLLGVVLVGACAVLSHCAKGFVQRNGRRRSASGRRARGGRSLHRRR
jgi:hypothetical protein